MVRAPRGPLQKKSLQLVVNTTEGMRPLGHKSGISRDGRKTRAEV
jgi:hypothetical protein